MPSSPREDNAEETGDGALAENRSAIGSSLYLYGKSIANFEDARGGVFSHANPNVLLSAIAGAHR
jgi:hypothetical protein